MVTAEAAKRTTAKKARGNASLNHNDGDLSASLTDKALFLKLMKYISLTYTLLKIAGNEE